MPKTASRVPHYILGFETGRPKTKSFEDRDEMLRFLAKTDRRVSEYKINGHKQAKSLLASLIEISKQEKYSGKSRDFSQIALSVVERATGGPIKRQ